MQIYTNEKTPGIRTENGGLKLFPTLLLTVYVIAASVFATLSLLTAKVVSSEYFTLLLSVGMPIMGIAVLSKLTAGIKPLVPFCIITALILFMGADLGASSAIAVSILLLAASAYLFRNKLWYLALFATAAACVLTYLLTKNLLIAICAAAFLPTSIALWLSFEKKLQRVGAVCAISATLGISLILLLVAFIYSKEGNIYPSTIRAFFDSLREGLIASVSSTLVEAGAQLAANISIADATAITTVAVTLAFNLCPAIIAILLFAVSYVTHSLYISVISPTVENNDDIIHAISFKMSLASAIIFLTAFFAALILDYEGLPLPATVAQNIYLMLFPGLSMITFGFVGSITKSRGASCLTTLIYFTIFGLILFIPGVAAEIASVVISISAFVGAVLVIVSSIKSKMKNNQNNDRK